MKAATLLFTVLIAAGLLMACGGDDDDGDSGVFEPSTGGTEGGPEVQSEGPASKFAPFEEELDTLGNFDVYPPETFGIAPATWGLTGPFASAQDGETKADEWGYVEGFNVEFQPDGLLAGVLEGRYYVTVQVHLFEDNSGAENAFAAYQNTTSSTAGAEELSPRGLANEWFAFELVQGTVHTSETVAVFHRYVFRRGNVVVTVQTYGAQPFMTIDPARDVAVMIDGRLLGNTPAVEPTPVPSVLPGSGS